MGAKHGIMFKTAVSLEETGKVQIVALDKTGTITKGEPKVIGIFEAEGTDDVDLLRTAFALENKSEHPLAKAIVAYGLDEGLEPAEVSDFKALSGNGLTGILDGKQVYGGNLEFISSKVLIEDTYLPSFF